MSDDSINSFFTGKNAYCNTLPIPDVERCYLCRLDIHHRQREHDFACGHGLETEFGCVLSLGSAMARTHCVNGHEYTSENTRLCGTGRTCLTCTRESQQRHILRKSA